jgi:glycosyltransferase involved in cell wall biosynthesis
VHDVGEYLRRADVYVFPSLEEGMSNALLEACAWQRVIVASDIPPNRAVLGDDFPLLFRAGDTAGLVVALRQALTNDSLRAKAQKHVETRLRESSTDAVIDRLEKLIDTAGGVRHHESNRRLSGRAVLSGARHGRRGLGSSRSRDAGPKRESDRH